MFDLNGLLTRVDKNVYTIFAVFLFFQIKVLESAHLVWTSLAA